jgi:hypothetical protein
MNPLVIKAEVTQVSIAKKFGGSDTYFNQGIKSVHKSNHFSSDSKAIKREEDFPLGEAADLDLFGRVEHLWPLFS